jgi:PKD repeat protein
LNVAATLYDSQGTLVAFSNPSNSLAASFSLTGMPAGRYYLRVEGEGSGNPLNTGYSDYGSLGIYSLSGTVPSSGIPVASASANPTSGTIPLVVQCSSAGSYDPDGGALTYSWTFGNGTTSTEADPVVTYVTPGVYSAVLTVADDQGLSASASVQISVQGIPPSTPALVVATPISSTRMDVSWQDTADDETSFKIERSTNGVNFVQIATVGANVTLFSDTSVTAEKTYSYRVRASNTYGDSAYSNVSSATTPGLPPAVPTRLTARAASRTQINLTWKDSAKNETGFYVERSLNGINWVRIATLGSNVTGYASTGLTANTKYYYRVQSYNSSGVSAFSNVVSTKTKS